MKYKMNKKDYIYLGQYKCPLLYYWLCQNWANKKLIRKYKLPKIDGRLLILDGHLFIFKKDWQIIGNYTERALRQKDQKFFSTIFHILKEETNKTLKVSNRLRRSNKVGPNELKKFFDTIHDLEFPWFFMLPTAELIEKILKEELKKAKMSEKDLKFFFNPNKKTLLMKQNQELLNIQKELKSRKSLISFEKNNPELYKKIKNHIKKFKWFGMMHFWGSPFSEEKFLDLVKNTKINPEKKEKSDKLNKNLSWIKKQTQELSYWRQHIAETCAIASYSFFNVFNKYFKDIGLKYEQAYYLTKPEFLKILSKKATIDLSVIKEREKAYGLIVKNKKLIVILGKDLKDTINLMMKKDDKVNKFKGVVASSGIAKGKVKIVLSPKEVNSVERGDILVASETTPDFMPAIHRAKAIVTDIGGLTSHAAIVSREFGIPCIIGTKVATRVLKDGDLIEVDAEKGIVKIIKKHGN